MKQIGAYKNIRNIVAGKTRRGLVTAGYMENGE